MRMIILFFLSSKTKIYKLSVKMGRNFYVVSLEEPLSMHIQIVERAYRALSRVVFKSLVLLIALTRVAIICGKFMMV